jgi:hypothetical protein
MSDEPHENELSAVRAELTDARARLAAIEALLRSLYGEHCLGGARRSAAAEPAPEPNRRIVGTIGGGFSVSR